MNRTNSVRLHAYAPIPYTEEYAELLKFYNLAYKELNDVYLQVGETKRAQGWILDITSVQHQTFDLLTTILPVLMRYDVSFRIPRTKKLVDVLSGAHIDYSQFGKIIIINAENDQLINALSKELIELLSAFRGPYIPTDYHLGSVVYTRYGGINPIIVINDLGQKQDYIYNDAGAMIPDVYYIPFQKPDNVAWPFDEPLNYNKFNFGKFINGTYLITSTIKSDVKGHVYKAIHAKNYYPQRCIVKEGKHDVWCDDHGRDIQDRLRWQHALQSTLSDKIPVPKVYDLIMENGDMYLAMEYIKGISLSEKIIELNHGGNWRTMHDHEKDIVLAYLIQVVRIISTLHQFHYIHRDVTPANFIITKQNKILAIDMELAYSTEHNYPDPPFKLGTPGYMSPDQNKLERPCPEDDIYSIGALLIRVITGLPPNKFSTDRIDILKENLSYFTDDTWMIDLIIRCVDGAKSVRPSISTIERNLESYREFLRERTQSPRPQPTQIQKRDPLHQLPTITQESLNAILNLLTNNPGSLNLNARQTPPVLQRLGLLNGIAGPLYLLSSIRATQNTTDLLEQAYTTNYALLIDHLTKSDHELGLYHGLAGMMLAAPQQPGASPLIDLAAFAQPLDNIDLANGLAGIGIALLNCTNPNHNVTARTILENYVDIILSKQLKDGSWMPQPQHKINGLSYGSAGVLTFLLRYYSDCDAAPRVASAINKGLHWLYSRRLSSNHAYHWYVSNIHHIVRPSLYEGDPGIAYTFIKAYNTFFDPKHKAIAERALTGLNTHLTQSDFSLFTGIAGVGEVYLEAATAFQDAQWQDRAQHIAELLLHTTTVDLNTSRHWIFEKLNPDTIDLMQGTSGLLHFLLRYQNPKDFTFPILNTKRITL